LVCWKGFAAEFDTWESRENLKNAKEAIEEFEKKYWRDMEDVAQQECKKTIFKCGELPGKFTAKMLYGWSDKRYNQKYWRRMETMEGQETHEKRDNKDDSGGRRNRGGKIRS